MRSRVAAFLVALLAAGGLFVVRPAAEPARGDASNAGTTVSVTEGEFAGLEVTVSQTTGLGNQAVEITWTGATPTPRDRLLGTDYLQIMQCWGDPNDPADPDGLKLRETCQFGTRLLAPVTGANGAVSVDAASRGRKFQGEGYPVTDPADAALGEATIVPFRPAGGTATADGSPQHPFPTYREPAPPHRELEMTDVQVLATHFTPASTNEVPFALSTGAGAGRVVFEMQNASLAPHLSCGAPYTDENNQTQPAPKCSLVIVPRGHTNPYDGTAATTVHGSPFRPALWKNRIVVPLLFDPVAGACSLTKAERRTTGTELMAEAITSWQPALCAGDGPVYGYAAVSDFEVGRQVVSSSSGAPGLGFTADPVVTLASEPAVVHAPVALSGPVIALNIDANLKDPNEVVLPPEINAQRGLALSDLKLTPRLVAKLLTFSYKYDVAIGAGDPYPPLASNPHSLRFDREFLDLNPMFESWSSIESHTLNGLMVTVGSSVAAREVWRWIAADPAAKAWLSGTPDESGMVVNPVYKGLSLTTLDTYPKLDPSCARGDVPEYDQVLNCTFSYRPYLGGLGETALQTLRADPKASSNQMTTNTEGNSSFDPNLPRFDTIARQSPGYRFALSITDSASAARYGLYTAKLCKAGRGTDGKFTATDCRAPTADAMTAALAAAVPSQVTGVSTIDPAKAWTTAGAYPLTTITYAVADTSEPADARRDYAALLRYSAGTGQQPGPADGQLPEGYAPLTAALREQTMSAADKLQNWVAPTTPPQTDSVSQSPTTPPASVPASGLAPSPGLSAPTTRPTVAPVAQSTLGSPLGMIRFLLVVALVMGLLGGVAGPIMQRLATRTRRANRQ
ncbi:hypothetical protein [Phytohabitans rumicis]|uniref:PBP domain-containing protein n=1 Tax=Phytohabitans rumicis TaxID=1076125 RepID=A0A6V8KXF4_9ACTN|nr:hypothetical protein [Phytohabitans rumicis]GFJ86517.1 hypothetical protein Prum_001590 [Phytohabitans rumicis]